MSDLGHQPNAEPHRGSARLDGTPGAIAAPDLLGFAETLVSDAQPGARIAGATLHLLGRGASARVTGEAQRLSPAGPPVWRVSLADDTGAPLAEITLTLAAETAETTAAPPVPRRSADADERRTRIALAARDVFAAKGYTAATMREIAAAAGMHVPTMYQYFRSKEEILELVYSWTIGQALEGMEEVLDGPGPAAAKMDAIVRRLHEVNEDLRRGTLVMNRETRALSRAARDRVLGRYARMVRRIGDVIAEGQKAGAFRPMNPQLAAVFIDALADVWVLRPFAVGPVKEADYAAELVAFIRGALTRDAANNPFTAGQSDPNRRE